MISYFIYLALLKIYPHWQNFLETGLIIGGWDKYEGGQIYGVPLGGTIVQQPFTIGGMSALMMCSNAFTIDICACMCLWIYFAVLLDIFTYRCTYGYTYIFWMCFHLLFYHLNQKLMQKPLMRNLRLLLHIYDDN